MIQTTGTLSRALFALSVALLMVSPTYAPTWTVCSSGCDYTSIQAAVNAADAGDTIELGAETFIENVEITKNLSIQGVGPTQTILDGDGAGSTVWLEPVVRVEGSRSDWIDCHLSGMTIQNGVADPGGGISSRWARLSVDNCVIRDNFSYWGGGISADASDVVITNDLIVGNIAENGAGISVVGFHDRSTLAIVDSIIRDNSSIGGRPGWEGGGVELIYSSGTIINSAIIGNVAYYGGGVFAAFSSVTITNSTISDNWAYQGGGIETLDIGPGTQVINSTISGNYAYANGGGVATFYAWPDQILLRNSILSNKEGGDCDPTRPGAIISAGFNLFSDDTCDVIQPTDLVGVDPHLLPLADNGGPTPTHALASGSPAIDFIPATYCTDVDGGPLNTDQRGVTRPQGLACDVGAYELEDPILQTEIDIQPQSLSPVNLSEIPVLILGSESLRVTDIDETTIHFGPAEAACVHDLTDEWTYSEHLEDVNLDGFMDLMTHFVTGDTGINCDDETATLTGSLMTDGTPFEGVDSVYLGECRRRGPHRGMASRATEQMQRQTPRLNSEGQQHPDDLVEEKRVD